MAILRDAPAIERARPNNYEFDTTVQALAQVYTADDVDRFVLVRDESQLYRVVEDPVSVFGPKVIVPNARPMLSMEGPSPLPGPIVVATVSSVDIPTWAIKVDGNAGVTVVGVNEYMEVGAMFDQPARVVRIFANFALTIRDSTGSGGTIEWTVDAITGTDLGEIGEVIIESTTFVRSISSAGIMSFGSGELFDLPGDFAPLQFGYRISHNGGGNRTITVLGHELQFFEMDQFVP